MDGKVLKFETIPSMFEQVNEEFMRVKVHVCYAGKNRNGSIIEKDVLDELAKTVYGVPVVGELDEETMRFKGHGGKLEITEDGWKEVKTTIPYGFVDPTTPFTYETVLENDGMTENEYLTVGCYLWKGRYPELVEVFENGTVKQSMEIMVENGDWDDNFDYFNITKARFTALCLLGVEPCFESSKAIVGYSLENHETLYQEMMSRFKQFTLEATGGETMEETQVIQETEVVEVETTVATEEAVASVEETTTEETTVEEVATEEYVAEETAVEETTEVTVEEATVEEVAVEETETFTEDKEPMSEIGEVELPTDTDMKPVENPTIDYEARIAELECALAEATRELESMKEEYARLAEFEATVKAEERKAKEEALFSKFSELADFEGFAELKESAKDFALEDLELKLFALLGKKNFSMSKPKEQGATRLSVANPVETETKTFYGGRFDKYFS